MSHPAMSGTRRQQIAQILRTGRANVQDIARKLQVPIKQVLDDLAHVKKSVRPGEKWVVEDAECTACGFVFRGRERLGTPSRCPECRSEQIRDAAFEIRGG